MTHRFACRSFISLFLASCTAADGDTGEDVPLVDEYTLQGDDAFPESAAWDPERRAFYTGSLARGDVSRIAADGTEAVVYAGPGDTARATVGLEVDVPNRWLWACSVRLDAAAAASVWVIDLDTDALVFDVDLSSADGAAACTDVLPLGDGRALVTDREHAAIYVVDAASGIADVWSADALLTPELIGLNGIVLAADGQGVLVSKYLSATLLYLSLPDASDVHSVELTGASFEGEAALSGADDIVLWNGELWVAMVDRLFRVLPADATWTSGTATMAVLDVDGVTGLVLAEDRIYGTNGQAVSFSFGVAPDVPFWIRRFDTLSFE
jgi:sugar lactone lactonase YvrE